MPFMEHSDWAGWPVLAPTQMVVLPSSRGFTMVAPMLFASQLTLSLPDSHHSGWMNPRGENGETPGVDFQLLLTREVCYHPVFLLHCILVKSEILSTKHETVRQAHHPEPSRRANPKFSFGVPTLRTGPRFRILQCSKQVLLE